MTKSDSVTAPLAKNDYMTSDDESNPMHPSANNNIASLSTSYPDRPSAANSIDSTSTTGNWQRDLASDWDYCLVFPAEKGELGQRQRGYIFTLRKLGFELFLYKNINANHEIYVLLRVPLEKLRAFADNIDYVMLLDSKEIEQQLSTGDPEAKIEPVEIAHMPEVVKYHPYEKIYGKYSRNINEILYYKEAHMEHPFREIVRMKLISMILESRPPGGGQNLKIRRYIRSGWLKACFPLHNRQKTETLETKWKLYPYQKLPLNDLKEYFGEKVTLYFGFVEHYTQFLMFPAVSSAYIT